MKILVDTWRYRYALHNLVLKDFRIRYRNMSLGVLWSLLNPLVMMSILTAVFTFVYAQHAIPHYPVFILIGLTCYNMLNLTLPTATTCILDNASIVKKIPFPRHILPVSVVLSQSFHILLQFGLVFLFMQIRGISPTLHWVWLPPILAVLMVFVIGASLLISALNVYFRDVRYLTENGLAVFFWLSPVFYPLTAVTQNARDWIAFLYQLNPLAGCIDAVRRVLLLGTPPDPTAFGLAACVSLGIFVAGFTIFCALQPSFADSI